MDKEIEKEMEALAISEFEKEAETIDLIMSDKTPIRVLRTIPPVGSENGYKIIVNAGWGSIIPSWDEFLMDAKKDFEIIYLESREKASCQLSRKSKVGMERMAFDIKEAINQLEIDEDKLVLFGSCLGATIIVYGLFKKMYNPQMPVLIAPPPRFEVPPVLRQIIPIAPPFLFGVVKPIVRWWIKKFKTESPKQAAKYIRALNEANGWQWKKVGLPLAYKRYWKIFPQVKNKILLVAAEKDKMHDAKTTKRISTMMENSIYTNLGTNKNTHAPIMVETIRDYIPEFMKN
ncbi:MAG: hypothetical protein V3V41_00745 [Candidatus Heimdallarchaeota archaeon]